MIAPRALQTSPALSFLKKGIDFLKKDYEQNELTINFIRYIALWGHPLYYILCAIILPQPYESFELRFGSAISFIPILFYKRYPVSFRPWLMIYWYLWLTFTFPVVFTFLMLMNNFSGLWLVAETVMLLVFIIFIPNLFLFTFLLIAGLSAAYAGYVLVTGTYLSITTQILEYFVSIPVAFLLGMLVNYTNKKGVVALERNTVLQSLAGTIAHEMRNPLGQIRNCLNGIHNLLPRRHRESTVHHPLNGALLENLYERVAHGQIAVKRGVQVIDMVLGEIREKPINPESFTYLSAYRIVRNALDEYGYETENDRKRVRVEMNEPFIFRVNETLFVFVLFNLLKNALYYFKSHPQSQVTVRLEKGEPYNFIFFRDTGPGIPKEALPRIFDSYFTSGKTGGTGLGLAYCKRVLKSFGGDIRCESEEGKYTEFIMSLPFVSSREFDEYTARIVALGTGDFRGKRVLIVDDDPLYRITLKKYLAPFDVITDEAANGSEALELLTGIRYNLVIMDLNMPSMSGYETVERMRLGEAGAEARSTPVVAHSSEPAAFARSMSENAGLQAFIAKPCSQSELINTLRAALHTLPDGHAAQGALSGKKVLVVDDSALNCDLIAMNLKDAGLDVSVSNDGARSLEILHHERFDLLVTDIRMPGMDGLELTRKLRSSSDPRLRTLPVIGLSGAVEEEETAKKAGMNDFRVKTDSPGLLLNSICRLLFNQPDSVSAFASAAKKAATSAAVSSYGLSPSEKEEFVGIFIDEFRNISEDMRKMLDSDDIASLRGLSHKVKGSASLIGLEAIWQAAEELETECRSERRENLENLVTEFISCMSALTENHSPIKKK
jgi:CheY-like chemotaxis protein